MDNLLSRDQVNSHGFRSRLKQHRPLENRAGPVHVLPSTPRDDVAGLNVQNTPLTSAPNLPSTIRGEPPTLDNDDVDEDDDIAVEIIELDDDDDIVILGSTQKSTASRNSSFAFPKGKHRQDPTPLRLSDGKTVGRDSFVEFRDGTFMKVAVTQHDIKAGHILVGDVFVRSATVGPHMPKKQNGLLWETDARSGEVDVRFASMRGGHLSMNKAIQKIRVVERESPQAQGLWKRSLKDVLRLRELRLTNQYLEEHNRTGVEDTPLPGNRLPAHNSEPLVCWWKETVQHDNSGKWKHQKLERIPSSEADAWWRLEEEILQAAWRGQSSSLASPDAKVLFADAFCGAGRVSCGAQQAGLKLMLSFDHDENKIATYHANFPDCRSLILDVSEFISRAQKRDWRVDILHISFPCQAFSPANTKPNESKDELNTAPLLGCADLLKALRPRIVTIEETPGLLQRHQQWFNPLIAQFTELNFSLRWSILKCADFGVPQTRKRLFIIAAAPGEVLPPFPEPTHTSPVTIQDTLTTVEEFNDIYPLTYHNEYIKKSQFWFDVPKEPYHGNHLAKTITTNSSILYHPSGQRPFTPRELAALQSFPLIFEYGLQPNGKKFGVTELGQQNGNAVPPLVYAAVVSEVVKSLRESDESQERRQRIKSSPAAKEVEAVPDFIMID